MKAYVFAPDLTGAALIDPRARAALDRWRDGEIKAVINRQLLLRHLKALRDLGLSAELIKRWSHWFTAPEKTIFLENDVGRELCDELAAELGVQILCWKRPQGKLHWVTAAELKA